MLVLIQIGGFGFMTSATLLLLFFRRRIGLRERLLAGETIGVSVPGGVVQLIRNMALLTLALESAGALVLFSALRSRRKGLVVGSGWRSSNRYRHSTTRDSTSSEISSASPGCAPTRSWC